LRVIEEFEIGHGEGMGEDGDEPRCFVCLVLAYTQLVCELFVERLIVSQVLDENGDLRKAKSKDWFTPATFTFRFKRLELAGRIIY
jgi:hypothetical protein